MQEAHTSSSLLKGRPGIKGESGGQTWEPLVAAGPEVSRELSEAEVSRELWLRPSLLAQLCS